MLNYVKRAIFLKHGLSEWREQSLCLSQLHVHVGLKYEHESGESPLGQFWRENALRHSNTL